MNDHRFDAYLLGLVVGLLLAFLFLYITTILDVFG